jgi:hypothetical protein
MREAEATKVRAPYASVESVPSSRTAAGLGVPSRVLLEARLLWGGDPIAVRHLAPRPEVKLRDLGIDVEGDGALVVARRGDDGAFGLRLPDGALVPAGCRMNLRMGRATLRLALVADDAPAPPRARPDARVAFGIFVAAALHLVVLGLVKHGSAPPGSESEASRETMLRMMSAAEERALAELAAVQRQDTSVVLPAPGARTDDKAGALAGSPAKERGQAGNPMRATLARARVTRGEDHRAARPERDEVATFGILSILEGDRHGNAAGSSAFAAEIGPAAMGNIFGATIDEAAGAGGLGLSGAGEGGGGLGAGVPLASIGALGRANGDGTGQGFGCCGGYVAPRREHQVRSPVVWGGDALKVNGRLPPEAVQRVVRQSFGRLRACYEAGLLRSPDLEGRIAVKFVIDRDGQVAMASTAESTLGDASVAACVAHAYESMSFPRPEGGIVTVVYPVVFTRTSP